MRIDDINAKFSKKNPQFFDILLSIFGYYATIKEY